MKRSEHGRGERTSIISGKDTHNTLEEAKEVGVDGTQRLLQSGGQFLVFE